MWSDSFLELWNDVHMRWDERLSMESFKIHCTIPMKHKGP